MTRANRSGEHPELLEIELRRNDEAPARVQEHLEHCAECQAALASLENMAHNLRAADEAPAVSADTDRAMLEFIHRRAAEVQAAARPVRRFPRRLAWAAAAVVLCLAGLWAWHGSHAGRTSPVIAGRADINGDGAVDIIDAYLMAQRLEAREVPPEHWDFNRDGRIDREDVNTVAARAVQLDREGS